MRTRSALPALLCLCAAASSRATRPAGAAARDLRAEIDSQKVSIEKAVSELEGVAASLEELTKTYPGAPDLESLEPVRNGLRRRIEEQLTPAATKQVERLQDLRLELYAEKAPNVLYAAGRVHRDATARRRDKAGLDRLEKTAQRELAATGDLFFELGRLRQQYGDRILQARRVFHVDEAAYSRESEARSRLKLLRMAGWAGAPVFAAALWLVLRRRRAPGRAAAALLYLCAAAPAAFSAVGDGSAHHRVVSEADKLALEMKAKVESSEVRLEALTVRCEALAKRLEALGPAYASARDLDAAASERESLRRRMRELDDRIAGERSNLDDDRKHLEGRHGAALIGTIISLAKDARLREGREPSFIPARAGRDPSERAKAVLEAVKSSTGAVIRSDLDDTLELRETLRRSQKRTEAVQYLLDSDEKAFQSAREQQAKLRRIHLAFLCLCGAALAGAAWMFLRRAGR